MYPVARAVIGIMSNKNWFTCSFTKGNNVLVMTVMLACTIESARGRRLVYTVHGGLRLHVIGKTVAGPQACAVAHQRLNTVNA